MASGRSKEGGLSFANTGAMSRVVGNDLRGSSGYSVPAGWLAGAGPDDNSGDGPKKDAAPAYLLMEPCTKLDLTPNVSGPVRTYIQMFKRVEELVDKLKSVSSEELQNIMGLGKKMAKSHLERFNSFEHLPPKAACLLFGGDGLKADSFDEKDNKFLQSHFRFVSGLYGVLRPYDDIKPVRDVPMGAKLQTSYGETVDEFWGDKIRKQLVKDFTFEKGDDKPLLACALSEDYWVAVQPHTLRDFQPVFISFEGGSPESTGRGRGLFVRYAVRRRVVDVEGLKDFEDEDWLLDTKRSSDNRLVFKYVGPSAGAATSKKDEKDEKDEDGGKRDKEKKDRGKEKEKDRGKEKEKDRGKEKDKEQDHPKERDRKAKKIDKQSKGNDEDRSPVRAIEREKSRSPRRGKKGRVSPSRSLSSGSSGSQSSPSRDRKRDRRGARGDDRGRRR